MHFSRQVLSAAIMLACLAGTAHAGPAGCELNKVAPARVATKDPRVYFVAGANARASACPSAASACRLRAYVMPGDEVLVDPTDGPYLCAFFKSQGGTETRGWLPRALLELVLPPLCRRGNGTATGSATGKRRSSSSRAASGSAMWGSYDPERVRRGGVHVGELSGTGRPRGQTLAIGYDPDRSAFPPSQDQAPDACAAKLDLYGRYLVVEDNRGCGGLNVSFTGTYVRVKSLKRLGRM